MKPYAMITSLTCSILVAGGLYGCGSGDAATGDQAVASEMDVAQNSADVEQKWYRRKRRWTDTSGSTSTGTTDTSGSTSTGTTDTSGSTSTGTTDTSGTSTGSTGSTSTGAPFVTGVSNSSGTLTISGSGFGSAKVTPLLWDDFEGGTDGASISSTPKVGSWNVVSSKTIYTTAQRHSGAKSLYAARTPSAQWGNFDVVMPDGRNFVQSFWFRYSYPAGGTGQTKLAQIHGTYQVGDYNPGVMTGGLAGDWWASYIALASGMYNRVSYAAQPSQNAWHHYEAVLKQSDPGMANGSVTIRVDGQVVYQQSPTKTREISGQRWNLAAFFTGMTNFTSSTYTWIDDAYFSDSWARVVLCESPTYSTCTRKEIQPVKSWTTGGISATLNKGGFVAGQTAYLFVVDANGATNVQGYPVTIQ